VYAEKVNDNTIYDLASLTKILSSSLALMKLSEQKQFDYEQHLDYYFPELAGTNKSVIHYKDMLTHQSGLPAWLPFWQKTVDKKNANTSQVITAMTYSEEFPVQVAKGLICCERF
jgi:beta-N-acetylhexosaminidase